MTKAPSRIHAAQNEDPGARSTGLAGWLGSACQPTRQPIIPSAVVRAHRRSPPSPRFASHRRTRHPHRCTSLDLSPGLHALHLLLAYTHLDEHPYKTNLQSLHIRYTSYRNKLIGRRRIQSRSSLARTNDATHLRDRSASFSSAQPIPGPIQPHKIKLKLVAAEPNMRK